MTVSGRLIIVTAVPALYHPFDSQATIFHPRAVLALHICNYLRGPWRSALPLWHQCKSSPASCGDSSLVSVMAFWSGACRKTTSSPRIMSLSEPWLVSALSALHRPLRETKKKKKKKWLLFSRASWNSQGDLWSVDLAIVHAQRGHCRSWTLHICSVLCSFESIVKNIH